MNSESVSRSRINADILSVLMIAKNIDWSPISDQSIYRVIYLASVLYSFRYAEGENPFATDYHFSVDALGPYSDDIRKSLLILEANDYVEKSNVQSQNIKLGNNPPPYGMKNFPDYALKLEWFSSIIYLLGVYGEGRIYEFVIRDPEYRINLRNNTVQGLSIGPNNNTIQYLRSFKSQFESTLGTDANQIDTKEYLELYFDYIFSKVLKRVS